MEFRILGPLEVRSDGDPVDLGPPKQRALLALLLLHIDRVVPTERILEELWGDDAPGKENALWVHISRLRSALEPRRVDRGQSSVLVTRDHGYTIRADPSTLDSRLFETTLVEARNTLATDPVAASESLRAALSLWRGAALQDFTYEEFARTEITRLEELRLEAIEICIEAELRRGQGSELISELTTLVDQHPLRERPVTQLMRALYRAGRQAEALRACERYRLRIREELGLEPSPEIRRLEEQILLHDQRLAPLRATTESPVVTSPFKGLHAFQEADAPDFFGRDRLVAEVITRLGAGARLVALVGPSGSGKSSVARAGVVPALRKGSLPGSEAWLVASMVPGAHPVAELEAALLRSTIDAPDSLDAQLADPELGLLRAALRLLPHDAARLVLVIDQFEELFTVITDEDERQRFLANLVTAIDDPQGRVRVVITIRADSYHRPLAYGDFAQRLGSGVVNVLPLTTDELEEAAAEPAARRGVSCEPALLAELLSDVIGEPGALPIFQYALTELFDRRLDDRLTVEAYRSMGGARGVLTRQADDLYHRMTPEEQEATRQLFLRLVTITEQETWSRRRVPASEIVAIDVDVVTMESVIDQLGRQRFLAFDRDHASGAPTVEVAHEALLTEWERLRGWIEEGRADIARRAALDAAMTEWSRSGRDSDYLLSGKRLAEYESWRDFSAMRLTTAEHEYLNASIEQRDASVAAESARVARETGLARSARRGWVALVGVLAAMGIIGAGIVVLGGRGQRPTIALLVTGDGSHIEQLMREGFDRAAHDFDFEPVVLQPPFTNLDDQVDTLAASRPDLVIFWQDAFYKSYLENSGKYPDTTWAYLGEGGPVPMAAHEAAFLAGAAAALTTKTGTVGYVGGFQYVETEKFRAGYEAGVHEIDPTIEILAEYTSLDTTQAFVDRGLAHDAATRLYQRGADVVMHAAGDAGMGVFAAAEEQSIALDRHLWAIGADSDQFYDVPEAQQSHVLTSVIKRIDDGVYGLIRDYLDGGLESLPRELTLADGAVNYSTTGDNLSPETIARLEVLRAEIVSGKRSVPRAPTGPLPPPSSVTATQNATVTFDGTDCRYDGPTNLVSGDVLHVRFANASDLTARFSAWTQDTLNVIEVPADPGTTNEGYGRFPAGDQQSWCLAEPGAVRAPGPIFDVR
jgi:basic membrane lipoprotein Med (substrate-binding protein (PBP1-ABC) superfamily)/DNA-binding SARP family transcriptional activator